ncbi:hypothetical protein ARMGADRAFT_1079146 [Armillaria gallica]|uniref:Uncharacterized protein n=1 Tax=Armillaria gallica TaxID=47427 RepID=A0A2H3DSP0_ARMGA|nr:hypothetical protein ARMGADRAFT_1079146 [Armillaria gallica]
MHVMPVGLDRLRLSVSYDSELSTLAVDIMNLYANALTDKLELSDNFEVISSLKKKLLDVIISEGAQWNLDVVNLCQDDTTSNENDCVSRAVAIVTANECNVPCDSQAWSEQIMTVAKSMSLDEIAHLKSHCPPRIWAALVFTNIHATPARVLDNVSVGKVKIADWDLFPKKMEPACGNCA